MKFIVYTALIALLSPAFLQAHIEIDLGETQATENKALVSMTMKNSFAQPIKSARVWMILMDSQGKIVGNQAQWLTGNPATSTTNKDKPRPEKGNLELEPNEQQDFSVAVDTTRKVEEVKLTFSRIVMADGTLLDPRKDVVAMAKKSE